MAVNDIGANFSEELQEISRHLRKMSRAVDLDAKAFFPEAFSDGAKPKVSMDARLVSLFALQTTELCHESFSSSDLHGVNDVGDFHGIFRHPITDRSCV